MMVPNDTVIHRSEYSENDFKSGINTTFPLSLVRLPFLFRNVSLHSRKRMDLVTIMRGGERSSPSTRSVRRAT